MLKTTLMRDRTQIRTLGLHTTLTHEESTSTAYSLKSPHLNLQELMWLNGPITGPRGLAAGTATLRALRPHSVHWGHTRNCGPACTTTKQNAALTPSSFAGLWLLLSCSVQQASDLPQGSPVYQRNLGVRYFDQHHSVLKKRFNFKRRMLLMELALRGTSCSPHHSQMWGPIVPNQSSLQMCLIESAGTPAPL